jgi:hypothetical protein
VYIHVCEHVGYQVCKCVSYQIFFSKQLYSFFSQEEKLHKCFLQVQGNFGRSGGVCSKDRINRPNMDSHWTFSETINGKTLWDYHDRMTCLLHLYVVYYRVECLSIFRDHVDCHQVSEVFASHMKYFTTHISIQSHSSRSIWAEVPSKYISKYIPNMYKWSQISCREDMHARI